MSMYYNMRFYGLRGRWPSWADACGHCTPEMVEFWKQQLGEIWTDPPDGADIIADPPEESLHQPIGILNSPDFGPEKE